MTEEKYALETECVKCGHVCKMDSISSLNELKEGDIVHFQCVEKFCSHRCHKIIKVRNLTNRKREVVCFT